MLSPSLISTVFSQIESLVYFRNKKNHKSNHSEINQIIKLYASEAERHFIRCLFSSIDCSNETKSQKDLHQVQYFSQELSKLLTKFNFVSLICYSIEKPLLTHKNDISPIRLFSQITQISTLNRLQEVILGLSLTHTNDAQLNTSAKHWVHQKLSDFIQAHLAVDNVQTANTCGSSTSAGGSVQLSNIIDGQTTSTLSSKPLQDSSNTYSLHEISTELLHFILSHLFEDSEHYGLSDSVMTNFIYSLRTDYPRGCSSMLLNTFLYPDIVGHPMIIKTYQTGFSMGKSVPCIFGAKSNSIIQIGSTNMTTSEPVTLLSMFTKSSICGCGLSSSDPFIVADFLEELGYACTIT